MNQGMQATFRNQKKNKEMDSTQSLNGNGFYPEPPEGTWLS